MGYIPYYSSETTGENWSTRGKSVVLVESIFLKAKLKRVCIMFVLVESRKRERRGREKTSG